MKSVHNKFSYITITSTPESHQGKLFKSTGDTPPKIEKSTPFATGRAVAKTVRVSNVKEMEAVLASVSQDPCQAIILGFAKGTEPDDNNSESAPYQLCSQKDFAEKFPKQKAPYKKPTIDKESGVLHACRTKGMFERSSWMGFDLDMSPQMPKKLKEKIATTPYIDLLVELCPALSNVSYLTVQSASSRVLYKGKPMSEFNTHIYMQCKHPSDMDRFSASMLLRSVGTDLGYIHPVVDLVTGEISTTKRGVPSTIFDRSVFSKARVMFEGAPKILDHDPEVINGNLVVTGNKLEAFTLKNDFADTMHYKAPTIEQQTEARLYMDGGGSSFTMKNMTDLLPDTKIEVKNPDGTDERIITMEEFVLGDDVRLRCQNPFKRESTSWSGFLSKADYEGNPIDPYLSSQEFGNFYYNDALDLFGSLPTGAETAKNTADIVAPKPPGAITAPAPPGVEAAKEVDKIVAPKPPEKVLSVKDMDVRLSVPNRYALTPEIIEANARRTNLNNPNIDTPPLPDEAPDDTLAVIVNDLFKEKDGSSNLLSKGANRPMESAWNGQCWEDVQPSALTSYIAKCANAGSVKKLTHSKIQSVAAIARLLNDTPGEVPYLPSHMVAFQNGVFDFENDEFLPSSAVRQYYFKSVKPFDYNPDLKDGLLEVLIERASQGDPEFVRQAWQMCGYGISGGHNIAHKIMYFDGVPRSGKSLFAQAVARLSQRTLNIEIGSIADLKIQNNIPDRSLLYDDDAQKIGVHTVKAVCGELKKMTGGAGFGIQKMYTTELLETFLHPKILIACNGLPLENDPSGAVHDRGLILRFNKSHSGSEDYGLQDRLKSPLEEATAFNRMVEGYRDLLAHNGFESMRAFTDSSNKTLSFVQCESSLAAQEDSLGMAQPLTQFFTANTVEAGEDEKVTLAQMEKDVRQWILGQPGMDDYRKMSVPKLKSEIKTVLSRLGYTVKKARTLESTGIECIIGIRSTYSAFGNNY